ncbi:MAG: hypothetical protein Q8867_09550, partial [Bacteroidota bacterium]|nr:hypothetical protein [Bacteroidota bacterium]
PLDSSTFMMMVIMHNCNMLRKNFKDFEHYKRFHLRVKDILESKESTDEGIKFAQLLNCNLNRIIMEAKVSIHA